MKAMAGSGPGFPYRAAGSELQLGCLSTIHSGMPTQAATKTAANGMFNQNQDISNSLFSLAVRATR